MKFVDCYWELENLGLRVCEVSVEDEDIFDEKIIQEETDSFDYVVIKVKMNHSDFNFGLSKMGFTMIETQLNLSKKYKDFNFGDRLVKRMLPYVDEKIVNSQEELEAIIQKMTPDMFSTDRIYLDPKFDKSSNMRRYSNWIRTEFKNNSSIVKEFIFEGKAIGFGMYRENNGVLTGLLGGIYEREQSEGYGLLTACHGYLTAKKNNQPFIKARTSISSNNIPMLQIYNYLGFKIDGMNYVFVKHNT